MVGREATVLKARDTLKDEGGSFDGTKRGSASLVQMYVWFTDKTSRPIDSKNNIIDPVVVRQFQKKKRPRRNDDDNMTTTRWFPPQSIRSESV